MTTRTALLAVWSVGCEAICLGGLVPLSSLSLADAEALGEPVRAFIAERVIPLEQEA